MEDAYEDDPYSAISPGPEQTAAAKAAMAGSKLAKAALANAMADDYDAEEDAPLENLVKRPSAVSGLRAAGIAAAGNVASGIVAAGSGAARRAAGSSAAALAGGPALRKRQSP